MIHQQELFFEYEILYKYEMGVDHWVLQIVHDELVKLMGGEVAELVFPKSGPTVILLAGLQGVGKTTVCAKLANYLKKQVNFQSPSYLPYLFSGR